MDGRNRSLTYKKGLLFVHRKRERPTAHPSGLDTSTRFQFIIAYILFYHSFSYSSSSSAAAAACLSCTCRLITYTYLFCGRYISCKAATELSITIIHKCSAQATNHTSDQGNVSELIPTRDQIRSLLLSQIISASGFIITRLPLLSVHLARHNFISKVLHRLIPPPPPPPLWLQSISVGPNWS